VTHHFWDHSRIALLAVLGLLAIPGVASAAQSFAVTSPTGFPAGGDPTYTTAINLDTAAGAPGKVSIMLAPGVLASVNANPACITGAPQYTSACQIGTGSASALVPELSLPLKAYLAPPPTSDDLVGIDLVTGVPGGPVTHAGAQLVQTSSGNIATALHLDLSALGALAGTLTGMSLTVDGTLNGKPFTRMPTNCSPGSSTVTIAYASKTETSTASPDFAPTGCSALPYHPTVTGSATQDAHDQGASVTTTVTQGANEAASSATTLLLPWPTLTPNLSSLSVLGASVPVGTATTTTTLLPKPLTGQAFFTGTLAAPTLTLKFPPPAVLTLTGTVSLAQHSVMFSGIPDVPVTNLTVTLFGGRHSLLGGNCGHPTGPLGGSFTGQNGVTSTASSPLTLGGCPAGPPSVSAVKLAGLSRGKPTLRFKLTAGQGAPKLKSFTLSLPRGLSFVKRGLATGVSVPGAHKARLRGRKLNVALNQPVGQMSVRISAAAMHESKAFRRHHGKKLKLHIAVVDAAGTATSLTASA
jgi:hypothetical protein